MRDTNPKIVIVVNGKEYTCEWYEIEGAFLVIHHDEIAVNNFEDTTAIPAHLITENVRIYGGKPVDAE